MARIYNGRLTKSEWATRLVIARGEAMTESNIRVGWRKTGLYPFAPHKLIPVVEPPPPPPPSTPPPTRTPLASIQSENRDFIRDHGSIMMTPIKRHITSLAEGFGAAQTKLEMARKELKVLQDAQDVQKKRRGGVTVDNLNTHIMTNHVTLGQVTAIEVVRSAKKGRGKGKGKGKEKEKAVQEVQEVQGPDSPGPSAYNPPWGSDLRAYLDS